MKYFKIVKDDQIVGAISSDDFIFRTPHGAFFRTTDEFGELAEFQHQFYRAPWMLAMNYEAPKYIEASILPISEDEYKAFIHAFESNEEIAEIEEEEEMPNEEEQQPIDPIALDSIEFIRSSKLKEVSYACRHTIESGFDIELSDKQMHHFSLDTQDQLNLITLSAMAETEELIPYHADGELCKFYSAAEIKAIVAGATKFKTYHTTYHNALKAYINSLSTIEEISAITYGIELPEEFQSDVLKAIS